MNWLKVAGKRFLGPVASGDVCQPTGNIQQKSFKKCSDTGHWSDLRIDDGMLLQMVNTFTEVLDQGQIARQFCPKAEPLLRAGGWWGEKTITHFVTNQSKTIELGNSYRLDALYQIGCKVVYGSKRRARIKRMAKIAPWLEYVAVMDNRTRDQHKAWDGLILRHDDPWWKTHMPSNGWRCRCTVHQLTDADLERHKLTPSQAPEDKMRQWQNKLTGEVYQVPVGIDPGWNQDVGALALTEGVEHTLKQFISMYLRSWYMFDQKIHDE